VHKLKAGIAYSFLQKLLQNYFRLQKLIFPTETQ
jgi:hypothetical protein